MFSIFLTWLAGWLPTTLLGRTAHSPTKQDGKWRVEFAPVAAERLEELTQIGGFADKTETLRKAMNLFDNLATEHAETGMRLYIEHPEGRIELTHLISVSDNKQLSLF